jgi:hypothetical protein
LLAACEREMRAAGFRDVEIVATLAGEPLYSRFGYTVVERWELRLANGLGLPVVRMIKRLPAS